MRSFGSVAAVVVFIAVIWVVAGFLGLGFSLWASLLASVVLTVLLNLVLGLLGGRRRRP